MIKKFPIALFLLIVTLANAPLWACQDLETALEEYRNELAAAYSAAYGNDHMLEQLKEERKELFNHHLKEQLDDFNPELLSNTKDSALTSCFRAISIGISDMQISSYGEHFLAVTQEMRERQLSPGHESPDPRSYPQQAYETLINARLFDLARQFEDLLGDELSWTFPYHSISADDEVLGQPAVLAGNRESGELHVELVAVNEGRWLVVTGHRNCPFSAHAMEHFETNHELYRNLLPENHIWVTTGELTNLVPSSEHWNKEAQLTRLHVAYDDDAWPEGIALDRTPIFYFLEDGKIVDQVTGWLLDDSNAETLEAALRKFLKNND